MKNPHPNLIFPDWPAPKNIRAATTLRSGGVSQGAFASLNTAMHVGDRSDHVRKNRQIIKTLLNLPSEPVWLEQIHGDRVIKAASSRMLEQADASYTDETGIVCAVMTADCLPLLVCAVDGSKVAAVHAGWRGLLAGVIGNTVTKFEGQEVMAWMGPAIGPECFEVGTEVRDAFLANNHSTSQAFKASANGKWLADIYRLARIELADRGIIRVYGGSYCTVTDPDRFYSYRREALTGRMATLIWRE